MASSFPRAPLDRALRSHSPLSQLSLRAFSQCSPRPAVRPGMGQNIHVKPPPQPSTKTRGKELTRAELPQDLGLLPGTYIRPLWRDMPSIFQMPRERLRLEWLWVKTGFSNFAAIVAFSKWFNKGMPLRLKERRQVAQDLHQRMYTAFAKGDVATLRKVCCTGLANSLIGRINARPKNETVTWSLDKYNRVPSTFLTGVRVVSDRASQLDLPGSGIRQTVVRITSRQSTGKLKKPAQRGRLSPETAVDEQPTTKTQDCTEYIVIQRLRWANADEEWRIWGHASPTTVEDLSSPAFAPGLSMRDRLEAMQAEMGMKK